MKQIELEDFDKAKKKDLTINNLVDGMDQDLESTLEWMRCTETREDNNL